MYLKGMWLGVNTRTETKETCVEIRVENILTISGSKETWTF